MAKAKKAGLRARSASVKAAMSVADEAPAAAGKPVTTTVRLDPAAGEALLTARIEDELRRASHRESHRERRHLDRPATLLAWFQLGLAERAPGPGGPDLRPARSANCPGPRLTVGGVATFLPGAAPRQSEQGS